jgi:TatD DNase family protein
MLPTLYFNIHTHRASGAEDCFEIENLRFGQEEGENTLFQSAGLHPWYVREQNLNESLKWMEQKAAEKRVLAIGEAGLDKITDTPWALQLAAFQACIQFSESAQKPLIIHCVRAYDEILAIKKRMKPQQTWIIHGFDKNWNTAEMLLRAGCCLSFGSALFRESSKSREVLSNMDAHAYFLETDDDESSIQAIYQQAAATRSTTLGHIKEELRANFLTVFGAINIT